MLEQLDFVENRVIRVGAEAVIKEMRWKGLRLVAKHRVPKGYRAAVIDEKVRRSRTLHEAKMLSHLSENGLPVPLVLFIDLANSIIYMQFIDGVELRTQPSPERYAERLGEIMASMHDMDIVHGDLTLANIIADGDTGIWLVDFGLSAFNADLEEKAVDIHLLERSATSTFPEKAREFTHLFLRGYSGVVGREKAREVLEKVKEIRSRGRYVDRG
ncbi:MAG: Kae1-associated kinase Bud32 [Candidatus Caldarchaeum sp.]